MTDARDAALARAAELARGWLSGVDARRVHPGDVDGPLAAAFGGPLPARGRPAVEVVEALAAAADPGLVASAGPRYFGFVTGGALPAAVAADWLASAWDQNAGLHAMSPAAAACEDAVARWLLDVLGLPADAAVGLVTGATMANVTCLAAARHAVLARAGWDVESRGLVGAPAPAVLCGGDAHASVHAALRLLGLGTARPVAADGEGRMLPGALAAAVAAVPAGTPLLVLAQAGDVQTGAFDPLDAIADVLAGRDAWLHVDGAFGLWAWAAPGRRHLLAGHARADSWATDAHKTLNVPYDCGVAIVRDRDALQAAVGIEAAYLVAGAGTRRDGAATVPEASRRARAFPAWAALASLGRDGLGELVEGLCRHASRAAAGIAAIPGARVLNDVVFTQVLVALDGATPDEADRRTRAVLAAVQDGGEAWLGGTTWDGRAAMRISCSSWATREEDVDRLVAAVARAAGA